MHSLRLMPTSHGRAELSAEWPDHRLLVERDDMHRAPELDGGCSGLAADEAGPHDDDDGARSQPWPGVSCDEPLGSVLGVDLSSRGLSGQLGASLAALDALRTV